MSEAALNTLKVKVGDIIQCAFFDNSPKAKKYGYHKPCKVIAVYKHPTKYTQSGGWLMTIEWPDGFQYDGLDIGWVNMPLHVSKGTLGTKKGKAITHGKAGPAIPASPSKPAQFEMFQ